MTVFLDHAAATPLRPEARAAWLAASEVAGNASSIHSAGQSARRMLEDARERLAALIGCDAIELVFTSGGTESINLALKGLWWSRPPGTDAIVMPDGEHHATLDTVTWLHDAHGAHGAVVRAVPLDGAGRILPEAFSAALGEGERRAAVATALVANNEVGTRNDPATLAAVADAAGVPLHLDAVGAFGHIDVDFAGWRAGAAGPRGLVALSVAAHKLGGPVGVGALVVSRAAAPSPLLHGGGQQRGLRSGTSDVAGAHAFAVAAELAVAEREGEAQRLHGLRERLVRGIRQTVPEAELLGDPANRLPGNAHILFPGVEGETLLYLLDHAGIAVSTGSACQAGVAEPSHVVLALGRSAADARSVLRLTLGYTSTDADVDAFLAALPDAHRRAASAARAAAVRAADAAARIRS